MYLDIVMLVYWILVIVFGLAPFFRKGRKLLSKLLPDTIMGDFITTLDDPEEMEEIDFSNAIAAGLLFLVYYFLLFFTAIFAALIFPIFFIVVIVTFFILRHSKKLKQQNN